MRGVYPLGDGKLTSALYLSIKICTNYKLFVNADWFNAVTFDTAVNGSFIKLGRLAKIY
jgi:hypothetical protein